MKDFTAGFGVLLLMITLLFLISLVFSFIPMMAWNYGLHSVFPQVPEITWIQSFWLYVLVFSLFDRPKLKFNS